MLAHPEIYGVAIVGVSLSLALWTWLARQVKARGMSRWRSVPLCLPLLLCAAVYGLYWLGFFSTPDAAVQLHAVRLTISHVIGPILPFITVIWLCVSLFLLLPLFRRAA